MNYKGKIANVSIYMCVRTFWGLQQKNKIKYEENWSDKMFQIEMRISDDEIFKAIAFYHHVIIKKQIN